MNSTKILKLLFVALTAAALDVATPANADTLVEATIGGVSSVYPDAGYAVSNLFDGTPTVGSSTDLGNSYASNGFYDYDTDPQVKFDLGSTVTLDGLAYAQRSDPVATINLYFVSEATYNSFTPAASDTPGSVTTSLGVAPSEAITAHQDSTFDLYSFAPQSTEYVIAQFNGVGTGHSANPGGAELRFSEAATVPEPSTCALMLGGLAVLAAGVRLRRRSM